MSQRPKDPAQFCGAHLSANTSSLMFSCGSIVVYLSIFALVQSIQRNMSVCGLCGIKKRLKLASLADRHRLMQSLPIHFILSCQNKVKTHKWQEADQLGIMKPGWTSLLFSGIAQTSVSNNFGDTKNSCFLKLVAHVNEILLAYTLFQNGRYFSILLFTCKLALVAPFKGKYSFEFQV